MLATRTAHRTARTTGTAARLSALALAALLVLTGCGGEDETVIDTSSAGAEGAGFAGGGMDEEQLEKIQACLEAAGLEDAMPTDRPEDRPEGLPSGAPSERPSGVPSDLPDDLPSDFTPGAGGGPGGGWFSDPEVQEALDACGIELPQAPQRQE